jgi:hypothetical protein
MSDPLPFRPLGQYNWPSSPVNRGLDRFRDRVTALFGSKQTKSAIDTAQLDAAPVGLLDRLVGRPAHQPLIADLDATLEDWLTSDPGASRLQMIILPPCDREDLLGTWAKARLLPIFPDDGQAADLSQQDDQSAAPLVIPHLERRFLRSLNGLDEVRRMLDQLSQMDRRVIIGCNSWAWQFLRKSCEIDLVCANPLSMQAYNQERLRAWLGRLAFASPDDGQPGLCFRTISDGRDVFGNMDGEAEISSFMSHLAKRSLGIPWVAWQFWRSSLKVRPTAHDDPDQTPESVPYDPDTIWVSDLSGPTVPDRNNQTALLVLHALLIHGGLRRDQIEETVPMIAYSNVIPALQREGLIDETRGLYRCVPIAYPAIRDALSSSGYPMDTL